MRQSQRIISNAIIMWVAQVLSLVPQIILVPYLIKTIGEIGYGIYALVWALMMSIDQMETALQSGVVKYSAGFLAQNRIDSANKVVSASFVYSIFLGCIACVGILAAAHLYNDTTGQISSALTIVGIMVLFIVPFTPYIAVIQSQQRYYVNAALITISKYASLLLIILWFSTMQPSVNALVTIMAGMLFLSRFIQVPIAYRFVPGLSNRLSLFEWKYFKMVAAFGAGTVLASACIMINSTGIRWLMDVLVSTSFVAHLAIILMPTLLLTQMIMAMTVAVMPAASAYEAVGDKELLKEILIRGTRYTTIITVALLFIAGILMNNVIYFWLGDAYIFLTPYILVIFAAMAFMLTTSTTHQMLKGIGKLKIVVFTYFIGMAVVPITLIIIMLKFSHNPYAAVTVGLSVGYIACGFLQIAFGTKIMQVNLRALLTRAYVQPLLVAAIISLFSLGVIFYFSLASFLPRLIVSFIALLLFFVGIYIYVATASERQQIKVLIGATVHKMIGK